jgi:capsular polysaccharide biosynthesis protein
MNKRVVRRLLDTFFRRWWLYLVPLVLFSAVGVAKAVHSSSGYRSVGVIDVAQGTLLSDLTSIRGENFGYETPAASTSKTLNSLLRTDSFMATVAEGADLSGALERAEMTLTGLRQAVVASADGDNLLQIVARTDDPTLSQKLAQSTIDSFIEYVVAADVAESRAAEQFFQDQLQAYQKDLLAAQQALTDFAASHPGGPQEERPLDEQVEIERLKSAVTQAQLTFNTAQQKSDEARLATEQSVSDVAQRLRIIDQPEAPVAPEPRLMQMVTTVVIFAFVGAIISAGAVVLAAFMDRSLRSVDDVEELVGLPTLAVVPKGRASKRRHSRRESRTTRPDVTTPATHSPTRMADIRSTSERSRALKAGSAETSSASRRSTQRDRGGAGR